jgi:hypothetical protein
MNRNQYGMGVLLLLLAQWAEFKEGDSVTYQRPGATWTKTVKKITEREVVLECISRIEGQPDSTFELKEPVRDPGSEVGAESIRVEGKEFACAIHETVTPIQGSKKRIRRVWRCKDAPGGIVKEEIREDTVSGLSIIVSRLVKLDEKFKIGDRELSCYVMESNDSRSLLSTSVPGYLVQFMTRGDAGWQVSHQVVDFRGK